jgi:hypothetical protein
MSGNLSSLWKRLAKVEQRMAEQALRAELADCNCPRMPALTIANDILPEQFEAEMNLPCPVHRIRRLGAILRIRFRKGDGTEKPSPELDKLLEMYRARLEQADREVAHAPQKS